MEARINRGCVYDPGDAWRSVSCPHCRGDVVPVHTEWVDYSPAEKAMREDAYKLAQKARKQAAKKTKERRKKDRKRYTRNEEHKKKKQASKKKRDAEKKKKAVASETK